MQRQNQSFKDNLEIWDMKCSRANEKITLQKGFVWYHRDKIGSYCLKVNGNSLFILLLD